MADGVDRRRTIRQHDFADKSFEIGFVFAEAFDVPLARIAQGPLRKLNTLGPNAVGPGNGAYSFFTKGDHSSIISPAASLAARPSSRLPLLALISRVLATRRERAQLARLDRRLLADIGLSPDMAETEATRPLWDVPQHWRR